MSPLLDAIVRWIVTVLEVDKTHVVVISGYLSMASPVVVDVEPQQDRRSP